MDHNKGCQTILEPISDYISGEAAEALCAEIEEHLADCDNCRIMVDTLRKTIVLCQNTTPSELPESVRRRLYQVLDMNDLFIQTETP